MNEIYIDVGANESRVAVMDQGNLAEIHIERQSREMVAGNIYKGKVENVLPGMQAAFINIGLERNAFLYVKDAVKYGTLDNKSRGDEVSIKNVLKSGDEVLVQVSKEPVGSKGARVTTHIALPGRNIVLMPGIDYIGISRRIEEESERARLKALLSKLKPPGFGLIIRTEADGKEEEDFIEDMNFLMKICSKVNEEAKKTKAPALIHKDLDLVYRSIRDLVNRDTKKVVINDRPAYERAVELIELFSPMQKKSLELYEGSVNILGFYGIEEKMQKALSKKVWLKSGGYIVIDDTEALTSIDVNTGKFTGSHNLKDTVLLTNIEAAKEIARQLRLRDIGGIIVIDFIDMNMDQHRAMVLDTLKSELKKDRTKSNVLGITQLGLVEMTRKKVGKKIGSIMQKQCPLCEGSGRVLDEETIVRKLERELGRIFKETDAPAVLVEVSDALESYIKQLDNNPIRVLEKSSSKRIILKGLWNIEYSDIRIKLLGDISKIDEAMDPFAPGDRVEINVIKSRYLNQSHRNNLFNGSVSKIIYDEDGKADKIIVDIGR